MATITTTITPELEHFSLSGFVEPLSDRSYLSRGLVTFTAQNQSIALTGAGDNQRLRINFALPKNFAWAFLDLTMQVYTAAAGTNNWDNNGEFTLYNAETSGNRTQDVAIGVNAAGSGVFADVALDLKVYRPWGSWCGPLKPATAGENIYATLDMYNSTANDAAYVCDVAARFLQFDIEQVHHVGVNSPMPVRG